MFLTLINYVPSYGWIKREKIIKNRRQISQIVYFKNIEINKTKSYLYRKKN